MYFYWFSPETHVSGNTPETEILHIIWQTVLFNAAIKK